jgi:hypothetical protein
VLLQTLECYCTSSFGFALVLATPVIKALCWQGRGREIVYANILYIVIGFPEAVFDIEISLRKVFKILKWTRSRFEMVTRRSMIVTSSKPLARLPRPVYVDNVYSARAEILDSGFASCIGTSRRLVECDPSRISESCGMACVKAAETRYHNV